MLTIFISLLIVFYIKQKKIQKVIRRRKSKAVNAITDIIRKNIKALKVLRTGLTFDS
jgi:F0F1-type ATP synthase membrane subunit b/b'